MSSKYPISPLQNEIKSVPKEYFHIIADHLSKYRETQRILEIEKNQLLISKMISYTVVDTDVEININAIKQRENEQNILFLERYPILAARHFMGLPWGSTSPR